MPIYEYRCGKCGEMSEILVLFLPTRTLKRLLRITQLMRNPGKLLFEVKRKETKKAAR
jgi:hypothetical protein